MKKFAEFITETKLGHFIFLALFGTLFSVLLGIVAPVLIERTFIHGFLYSEAGSLFVAGLIIVTEDKRLM